MWRRIDENKWIIIIVWNRKKISKKNELGNHAISMIGMLVEALLWARFPFIKRAPPLFCGNEQ